MTEESKALTEIVALRLTKRDAELLQEEARRRGFSTPGGFARQIILGCLANENAASPELELLVQIRFMLAENFRAVTPEEEQPALERIQERAEAGSQTLVKDFLHRQRGRVIAVASR